MEKFDQICKITVVVFTKIFDIYDICFQELLLLYMLSKDQWFFKAFVKCRQGQAD